MQLTKRLAALESRTALRSSRWLRVIQREDETEAEAIARIGEVAGVNLIVRRIVSPVWEGMASAAE